MEIENEAQIVSESQPGARGGSKRIRKPKDGNSQLFNEILSSSNALSVSEKTRLVKCLAGQLSMVAVGAGELIKKAENPQPKTTKSEAKPVSGSATRPNPLKGTKFEHDKVIAYKALVEAKKALKEGEQLPPNDPRVVNYKTALDAYKAEHAKLKPMEDTGVGVVTTTTVVATKKKTRTTTDRSPPPNEERRSFSSGMITGLRKAVKSVTSARLDANGKQQDGDGSEHL